MALACAQSVCWRQHTSCKPPSKPLLAATLTSQRVHRSMNSCLGLDSWSKRNQHLGIASVIMPTVGDQLSEREKCARGPGMHRAGRGHHSGHSDGHLAHRFDATSSITSPRWLKRRQNQGQLAGSQSDVQRRLRLQPLACERRLYLLCT